MSEQTDNRIYREASAKGLCQLLRKAREAKGWSLSEAAEIMQLGTSGKASLHSLETGANANPTLKTLIKLVLAYGIRPEAIFASVVSDE